VKPQDVVLEVNARVILVDKFIDKLDEIITWGSNQKTRLWWWYYKKKNYIQLVKLGDLFYVFQRSAQHKKVMFLVVIIDLHRDDVIDEAIMEAFPLVKKGKKLTEKKKNGTPKKPNHKKSTHTMSTPKKTILVLSDSGGSMI
jgi:hypothetical protein